MSYLQKRKPYTYGSMLLQTVDMILGRVQAPWEDPETSKQLLKPLGIFKKAVLGLIARDPAQRCSIQAFQTACRRCLSNTMTNTT